jgi:hypothetical protein
VTSRPEEREPEDPDDDDLARGLGVDVAPGLRTVT